MAATPPLRRGYSVALPQTPVEKGARQAVTVVLDASGHLTVNGAAGRKEDLREKLDELPGGILDREVLFDGADRSDYQDVMGVLDALRASGSVSSWDGDRPLTVGRDA